MKMNSKTIFCGCMFLLILGLSIGTSPYAEQFASPKSADITSIYYDFNSYMPENLSIPPFELKDNSTLGSITINNGEVLFLSKMLIAEELKLLYYLNNDSYGLNNSIIFDLQTSNSIASMTFSGYENESLIFDYLFQLSTRNWYQIHIYHNITGIYLKINGTSSGSLNRFNRTLTHVTWMPRMTPLGHDQESYRVDNLNLIYNITMPVPLNETNSTTNTTSTIPLNITTIPENTTIPEDISNSTNDTIIPLFVNPFEENPELTYSATGITVGSTILYGLKHLKKQKKKYDKF